MIVARRRRREATSGSPARLLFDDLFDRLDEVRRLGGRGQLGRLFLDWFCGVVVVYAFLFGIGKILFKAYISGGLFLAAGAAAAWVIYRDLSKKQNLPKTEET